MLITVQEVADVLGVDASDAVLIRLVKSTDEWAKRSLGRRFERAEYTLYPRGYGNQQIFLRESPIRSLIEIRVDPTGVFGDDTIVDDLTPFKFDPDPDNDDPTITYTGYGYFRGPAWWPFPELKNAIQVKVEAGWWPPSQTNHTADVPEDLREKLIERAVIKFREAGDDLNEEMQSVRSGDRSWTKFEQTDQRILRELLRYKR